MSDVRICVNCEHHRYDDQGRWIVQKHRCVHPNHSQLDVVTGEWCVGRPMAHDIRLDEDKCGYVGKWWTAKEAP